MTRDPRVSRASWASSDSLPASVAWWLLAGSSLVPKFSAGGYSLGFEDAVAALGLPIVVMWLHTGQYRGVWKLKALSMTWFLIVAAGLLFGVAHAGALLGEIAIPSELWQYVKRFVYFALAVRFVHSGWVTPDRALRTLLIVFAILNAIGLLQLNSPVSEPLSALYSQDEVQLEALVDEEIESTRNYSVTGFSTSWGGLSAFMFYAILGVVAFEERREFQRRRVIGLVGLAVACLLNVLFSGSRAAMFSVAAVLPLFVIGLLYGPGKGVRKAKLLAGVAATALLCTYAATTLLAERLSFIQYRNAALVTAYYEGSNRFGDVQTVMAALDNPYWWLFGISNAVQRAQYIEWGVEVEPIYLLVNYGLVGLFLRYYLLWLVMRRAFTLLRGPSVFSSGRALGAAALLGVPTYLIFSLGYFFYQESVVGTLPWLLFGLVIGTPVYRLIRVPEASLQLGSARKGRSKYDAGNVP